MSFISPIQTNSDGTARQTGNMQSLGKDDFLQLLVAKLANQDPMNPMEDQDFVAQLAQFSSLEQMNNIAQGISTSNDLDMLQSQSINNTMAAGLIGKDVRAKYNGVYLSDTETPRITYTLKDPAAEVVIRIKDAEGSTVATLSADDLEAGVQSITWDGFDDRGNRAADGYYTVSIQATGLDESVFTPSLALEGTVDSIVYREGTAFLRVNGTEVPLGDITAIGEPGAFTNTDEDD
ncbi:MAG: flagellar hook capping FlgD N-terminal domain-containing protein [bacterium]